MAPSARIATFLVGLTVVFGAAFGLGRAVGPVGSSDDDRDPVHTEHPADGPGTESPDHGAVAPSGPEEVGS